jgi:hypothetical protein
MKLALWLAGLAGALAVALAANVLLLRTDGNRDDRAGTLSPKLLRPLAQPTPRPTGPATATVTTTGDDGKGRDHPEDD